MPSIQYFPCRGHSATELATYQCCTSLNTFSEHTAAQPPCDTMVVGELRAERAYGFACRKDINICRDLDVAILKVSQNFYSHSYNERPSRITIVELSQCMKISTLCHFDKCRLRQACAASY